jgi:hypothetical protein
VIHNTRTSENSIMGSPTGGLTRLAPWLLSLGTLLTCSGSRSRKAQLQPASEFDFERRPFRSDCAAAPPGATGYIISGPHFPFRRKQAQNLTLLLSEVPALTLTADESILINIAASHRDSWVLDFCSTGEGNTESEALDQLRQVSMERIGDTVSLNDSDTTHTRLTPNTLLVDAPATAPIVVHASFTAVQVYDMTGPVRVTATHARASILDTTGKVDAAGFVVDFAGSKGTVKLSSERDINVKLRAPRFEGSLMAWAQGPVRVLVPPSFQTPFQAIVNRPQDFVCRADICSKITLKKQGSLCIFTYSGDGSTPPSALHFRSELETLVIDNGK